MKNLLSLLLYIFGMFIIMSVLISCRVTRERCNQLYPPVTYHTSDTLLQVRETIVHDTTYIQADNSTLELTIEADTDRNVQVTEVKQANGKRSAINYTTIRNNKVLKAVFDCHCDSLTIYHTFKDRDTSLTVNSKQVDVHRFDVPAQLTWWQQFKVDYGGYSIGLHVALLIFFLLHIAWKIFAVATPQGAAISGGFSVVNLFRKLLNR